METEIDFGKEYAEIYGDWGYVAEVEADIESTALVVVDMQPAFVDSRFALTRATGALLEAGTDYFEQRVREQVIPNHRRLLEFFRDREMLIVYIVTWSETDDLRDMPAYQRTAIRRREKAAGEQVYRKWNEGMGVCPEIAPEEHELVIPKRVASAFAGSTLDDVLRNAGIAAVVLTGVNTNGCVFETAVVGKNMGYEFILVSDATACFAPLLQDEAENWIARHFGVVRSTEETLELLNRKATG